MRRTCQSRYDIQGHRLSALSARPERLAPNKGLFRQCERRGLRCSIDAPALDLGKLGLRPRRHDLALAEKDLSGGAIH